MRILLLAQRVPYPPHRGDKIATYHYVRHLARRHAVAVACLADGRADLDNVAGLASLATSVDAVVCSPVRRRVRALAALAGNRPLTVAYFDEPELRARVRGRLAAERFDVALVYGSGVAQFVEPFRDLPRVIQFSDLDSLKWADYAGATRPPRRWVYRTEARRLLAYERRLAATSARSLVCSEREAAEFRRHIPGVPVDVVRNGVDLDRFRPADAAKDPHNLVFTGVMNYLPNVDGAVWFCREVWPRVRAEVPEATFTVCGSSPTPEVTALGRLPGVTVTGAVPAVEPYLAKAGVGVIPVRIARGVQNKLLEAMAAGLPTVTTTAAGAGVEAADGRDLFVADDPAEFAAAVVRLLRDGRLRDRVGRAARAAVEANYGWDRTLARLDEILDEAAGARARPVGITSGGVTDGTPVSIGTPC
ncbi:MAG TPA: TIGR03087 family PEP-CTERM/XrtA system glycosyltransferase [Gemmataceae bacterium]|jgi:sugar transferase (PEP-CTERM/EpsH1 system associated)